MTRKKTPAHLSKPAARTRTVYELRPQHGKAATEDATSPAELAAHLSRVLALDPQDARAVAHVLHVTRATITAPAWSARRLGVLEFVPDDQPQHRQAAQQRQQQPTQHQDHQAHAGARPEIE